MKIQGGVGSFIRSDPNQVFSLGRMWIRMLVNSIRIRNPEFDPLKSYLSCKTYEDTGYRYGEDPDPKSKS